MVEFGGIEPNPTYETLMKAVEVGRAEKIDYLLAVGGGSVLDGTKFIAAAIPFEGEDEWNIVTGKEKYTTAVPIGAVLTLPATGSEMNYYAVISRKDTKEKKEGAVRWFTQSFLSLTRKRRIPCRSGRLPME